MLAAVRRSHVAHLVLATLAAAVLTAGPAAAEEAEGTICIFLGPPNDICVDHPLDS